ncbi:MAG: RnfABCDGE type electron transport complex subunit D [Chloroflexota bacterium]
MSKPKEYSWMTKDKLMTYTFVALLILAIISIILWWQITPFNTLTNQDFPMNLGLAIALNCIIAVLIAVGIDALFYKVASDSPLNTMSAAVFGLIVALSYTMGVPGVATVEASLLPLAAPGSFMYVALISLIGMVVFKKVQGVAGRKYVNPAATAKLLVLLPFLYILLIPTDHTLIPSLLKSIDYNGTGSFGAFIQFCFGNPGPLRTGTVPPFGASDVFQTMFLEKFHGWPGGASALAVIIVGVGLFVVARRYIKWRITAAYIGATIVMSLIMTGVYGGDAALRLMFELFIGSSIFLAFFMATDPATTPLTYAGQAVFGVGLAVLTVLFQTYANFFGGSIAALFIMNLTSPALDRVGRLKPTTESKEPKLPKAKAFPPGQVKGYECIRCGACMRVCCHKLSPILIKQAFDKTDVMTLSKLNADYCTGCGHCSFVCPSRIDLKGAVLRSKAMLRQEQ